MVMAFIKAPFFIFAFWGFMRDTCAPPSRHIFEKGIVGTELLDWD